MPRLTDLAEHLTQDSSFDDLPDWAVADALNRPDAAFPIDIKVSTSLITNYLARKMVISNLRSMVNSDDANQRAVGEGIKFILDGRWESLDTDDAIIKAEFVFQMDMVVSWGIITTEMRNDLVNMTSGLQSWAEQAGYGAVTAGDVSHARQGLLTYGE